jgi:hypothetical protein
MLKSWDDSITSGGGMQAGTPAVSEDDIDFATVMGYDSNSILMKQGP